MIDEMVEELCKPKHPPHIPEFSDYVLIGLAFLAVTIIILYVRHRRKK